MKNNPIYLDHAATTPNLFRDAYFSDLNPNSPYAIKERTMIKDVEDLIKSKINGHNGEIIWTSGGTGANFHASVIIQNLTHTAPIVSSTEHKSMLKNNPRINCNKETGHIDSAFIKDTGYARGISIQTINNETGVQPINLNYIGPRLAKAAIFHTDAVQAFLKMDIDVEESCLDLVSLSSHKIYGPKGLGCLWVRKSILNKQFRKQSWTLPVNLIYQFGKAVESFNAVEYRHQMSNLESHFRSVFFNKEINLSTNGRSVMPGLLNIYLPGVDAEELVLDLAEQGIYISTGAACSSGNPSHVLEAMGFDKERIKSSIRISFGLENSMAQAAHVAEAIAKKVRK